jgi:hypothetical protein
MILLSFFVTSKPPCHFRGGYSALRVLAFKRTTVLPSSSSTANVGKRCAKQSRG